MNIKPEEIFTPRALEDIDICTEVVFTFFDYESKSFDAISALREAIQDEAKKRKLPRAFLLLACVTIVHTEISACEEYRVEETMKN